MQKTVLKPYDVGDITESAAHRSHLAYPNLYAMPPSRDAGMPKKRADEWQLPESRPFRMIVSGMVCERGRFGGPPPLSLRPLAQFDLTKPETAPADFQPAGTNM
jgi:hypothetical protein